MADPSTTPALIVWLQGLAVPVIGGIGAIIAFQQVRIASVKLQHDLFERRIKIFMDAQDYIRHCVNTQNLTTERVVEFRDATTPALFLMDESIHLYLDEIKSNSYQLNSVCATVRVGASDPNYQAAVLTKTELLIWMVNQLPILTQKFRPFLQLDRGPLRYRAWAKVVEASSKTRRYLPGQRAP